MIIKKNKEVTNLLHRPLLLVFALHKDQPLLLSLQIIHMALQFVVEYCESVIEGSTIRHIAQRSMRYDLRIFSKASNETRTGS